MSAERQMQPAFLTPKDIAARWQVSLRMVQSMIERGDLPAVRLGPKLLRIRPADLAAVEASLCPTTASNDPSSTDEQPPSGTSAGPMAGARVAYLRNRPTR